MADRTWRKWNTRPKHQRVLAWFGDRAESVWTDVDPHWHWFDGDTSHQDDGHGDPTHWMPHPEDPDDAS